MGGRSSSKQGIKASSELDKIEKLKQDQPHVSGAYIRTLVKQLTNSRTKHPSSPNGDGDPNSTPIDADGDAVAGTQQSQPPQQPQQHKKQVRRRLHTSRPYQERLLNMAEARREIVTALKFHRAAMKQANEQKQQQQQQQSELLQLQPSPQFIVEQGGKTKSRKNPRSYASNTSNHFSGYLNGLSSSYSSSPFPYPPPTLYPWPLPSLVPPPIQEPLNFPLPNQTLGLNLNLHDFSNLETSPYYNSNNPSMYTSSGSSSSTSSSPPLSATTEEVSCLAKQGPTLMGDGDLGLHQAMDDKEMAEIRSIGEQHEMEWNDRLNLVTSAWWFKFLKAMEIEGPEEKLGEEYYGCNPFDEAMEMEFPSWLNANEGSLQHQLSDYCCDDYLPDPALPGMDIEEIEGMDGDWLA